MPLPEPITRKRPSLGRMRRLDFLRSGLTPLGERKLLSSTKPGWLVIMTALNRLLCRLPQYIPSSRIFVAGALLVVSEAGNNGQSYGHSPEELSFFVIAKRH